MHKSVFSLCKRIMKYMVKASYENEGVDIYGADKSFHNDLSSINIITLKPFSGDTALNTSLH